MTSIPAYFALDYPLSKAEVQKLTVESQLREILGITLIDSPRNRGYEYIFRSTYTSFSLIKKTHNYLNSELTDTRIILERIQQFKNLTLVNQNINCSLIIKLIKITKTNQIKTKALKKQMQNLHSWFNN